MKKIILTLSIIFFGFVNSNSQTITAKKVFGGYKFTQNGKMLKMADVVSALKSNEVAYKLARSAKSNLVISQLLGGAGGFMVGLPLGAAIGGGKANWTVAGIGAGLIIIAIPVSSGANKKMKKAVEIYNAELEQTSYRFKPEFKIISNRYGIGLTMNF